MNACAFCGCGAPGDAQRILRQDRALARDDVAEVGILGDHALHDAAVDEDQVRLAGQQQLVRGDRPDDADVGLLADQQTLDRIDMGGVRRVDRQAEIAQCAAEDMRRLVVEGDASVEPVRLEQPTPASRRLGHRRSPVGDAQGSPDVGDRVSAAGIEQRVAELPLDVGLVRQRRLLQRHQEIARQQPADELVGRHDHVIAVVRPADGVEHFLVVAERRESDVDAGIGPEIGEGRRPDIVVPVEEPDHRLLPGRTVARRERHSDGERAAAGQKAAARQSAARQVRHVSAPREPANRPVMPPSAAHIARGG